MKRVALVAALAATMALAACGNHDTPPQPQAQAVQAQPVQQVVQAQPAPQVVEQPAPQPQVVVQAPQQPQVIVERRDDGVANAIVTAAAINAMTQPRVVHVYHPPVVVAPHPVYVAPRPVYVAPRPVYVAPRPVYVAPRATVATRSAYRSR